MGRYKKLPENYFKFVNPIIVSLVGVGVYLLLMAWLDPNGISTTYFGRVAEFTQWVGTENNHLMKQIFLVALAIHIFEAMIAVFLCYKRGIGNWATLAWTIQTLLLGITSLSYLIWPTKKPKPDKKEQSKSPKKSKSKKETATKSPKKTQPQTPKKNQPQTPKKTQPESPKKTQPQKETKLTSPNQKKLKAKKEK